MTVERSGAERSVQGPSGVGRLLAGAAFRWLLSVLLFSIVGFIACVVCYAFLAPTLWHDVPGIPAARAGGFGAIVALIALLLLPAGYIGALYLLALPALFAFLGHHFGVRAGLGHLAHKKGPELAAVVAARIWPLVVRLSESGKIAATGGAARVLLAGSEEPGLRRRMLGWVLSAAKVPELVTSTEFLSRVKSTPEPARAELEGHLAAAIAEWTRVSVMLPLAVFLGLLVLATIGIRFWFG